VRIAIAYDCLYPYTIGGMERWYRGLAVALAERHEVTYLTRRQWGDREVPDVPKGVEVVALSSGGSLYTPSGLRDIRSPLRFGCGVARHLARHGRRYDVVHACAFPFFPAIAAALAERAGGPPVVTEWPEVWRRRSWRHYLGGATGEIGAAIQSLAIRLTRRPVVFSRLAAARLREEGLRGRPTILTGLYAEPATPRPAERPRQPLVVFAGRLIPEKRAIVVAEAIGLARRRIPLLEGVIFGDGPERRAVLDRIGRLGLREHVRCPGFRDWAEIDRAMSSGLCLLLPSAREGYGLVVVEAAARGLPAIVTPDEESAATELVEDGVNGFVSRSADPQDLCEEILRAHACGPPLYRRTRAWFDENSARLGIAGSIAKLEALYHEAAGRGPAEILEPKLTADA